MTRETLFLGDDPDHPMDTSVEWKKPRVQNTDGFVLEAGDEIRFWITQGTIRYAHVEFRDRRDPETARRFRCELRHPRQRMVWEERKGTRTFEILHDDMMASRLSFILGAFRGIVREVL